MINLLKFSRKKVIFLMGVLGFLIGILPYVIFIFPESFREKSSIQIRIFLFFHPYFESLEGADLGTTVSYFLFCPVLYTLGGVLSGMTIFKIKNGLGRYSKRVDSEEIKNEKENV